MRRSALNRLLGACTVCRVLVMVSLLGVAAAAAGQGTNGVIQGTIVDEQGGVLPGVTVTLRNVETGVLRTTVTGVDGQYRFPALPSGRYDVEAELPGFSLAQATSLNLLLGQEIQQDLKMAVGTLQETVTVAGSAPVVETTQNEVSAVITAEQIATLPVSNRQAVTLSLLLPGTSQDGSRPRRNNAQVGAGTLQFTTNHLVDGTMNMSTKAGEPRQDFPQSAIREFKVLTSQAPAEYGGRAGGVVSVITRGGTNLFSGEAYEFFRNKALIRPDSFKQAEIDRTGEEEPRYERHQFGGAFGGPVVRDRLHFFIAAESTDEKKAYQITSGKPEFYGKYEGIFTNQNTDKLFFVRGDMQINPNQSLFVRWGYQSAGLICEGCGGSDATGDDTYIPRDSFVTGHTWIFGSRMLNEARFQWAQQWQYQGPNGVPSYRSLDFGPERFENLTQAFNFPSFSQGGGNFFVHHAMIREFRDDFTMSFTDHNLKIGGSYQNIPLEEDAQGDQLGTWSFATDQYFDADDPVVMANLKGPINNFTASFPPLLLEQPHHYFQLYVDDEWRVRSNVTLSLGLRYELDTLIWNENRDMSFYPRPLPLVDFASRGDDNNVSPRVGLAWDLTNDGRTVVRAGVGRQFNVIMNGTPGGETNTLRQNSINIRNPPYPDPYGGRPPEDFLSTAPPNISILDNAMENPYSDTISAGFSRELRTSMALHVDGVYTKSDKFNATVRINTPVNPAVPGVQPMPEWGVIQQVQSVGWQKYQALLARLEKRFADRHQYTISYTWAKVTDNSFGGTSTGNIVDVYQPQLSEGYGNADRRHALVASGAVLLPHDFTLGMVWALRTGTPFSATAGVDLNADGANTDYVPGTHKGQGQRDLDLGLVNAWRAQRGFGPISADQIDSSKYNRTDVRLSKAFGLGATRKAEFIFQVFNIFGIDNLGGIGVTRQTNSLSDAFGQILGAQPKQEAELAIRFSF